MSITFAPRAAHWKSRSDGTLLIESPVPLGAYERDLGSYLRHWARAAPERSFLCERTPSGEWRRVSYSEALAGARSVAQWLIDQGFGARQPALILSPASIEHALLALGCLLAGVPFAPVSPALSLGGDFRRLRAMAAVLKPGLVFAEDEASYGAAMGALSEDRELVRATHVPSTGACQPFSDLLARTATAQVDERGLAIQGSTVVKYLFTSGSTGAPKVVPNTHRMLCANQKMMELLVRGEPDIPPVFVDWLPWSHTFGGNVTFHWILRDGGTLFIDAGKPIDGAFDVSLRNLRDVSPTHYFNVPAGYAMLADALERHGDLARSFFARLQCCFYGGASLPQSTWDRLQSLAVAHTGHDVMFTTGCGSTETGPIGTFLHWPVRSAGIIGLPAPGVRCKLVPVNGRLEMRLQGPNIFEGYLNNPEATAQAFDDEGFYCTGDAVRLLQPSDPAQGLVFDGRVAEDFKLATGTFVQVGNVRINLLSAVGLLQDAVLAGGDRPWLGALVWLDPVACRSAGFDMPHATTGLAKPLHAAVARQLATYNASASGSSERMRRLRVILEAPSALAGEITEKGYINQRAVLDRRAGEVDKLFSGEGDGFLIDAPAGTSNPRSG